MIESINQSFQEELMVGRDEEILAETSEISRLETWSRECDAQAP